MYVRAGGGRADRHRHRGELGFDVDELAVGQRAVLHHFADAFDDVRLRRDRVGDHLRRQSAIASATACEPSVCLSMDGLQPLAAMANASAAAATFFRDGAGELVADGLDHGFLADLAGDRGKGGKQRHVGHRAADMLQRDLGRGQRAQAIAVEPAHEFGETQLVEAASN